MLSNIHTFYESYFSSSDTCPTQVVDMDPWPVTWPNCEIWLAEVSKCHQHHDRNSNSIHCFIWYIINYPKPNFIGGLLNSSPPGQNGRHLADDVFRCIFMNEKFCVLIEISLKFVPKGPIGNSPTLVQIMAWRRIGDKPLPDPMLTRLTDTYLRY